MKNIAIVLAIASLLLSVGCVEVQRMAATAEHMYNRATDGYAAAKQVYGDVKYVYNEATNEFEAIKANVEKDIEAVKNDIDNM